MTNSGDCLRLMVVGDGMADLPMETLGGLTPLKYHAYPQMAELAGQGGVRRVQTIPDGFPAGTETAMPLITGYNTSVLTGRGPVEAAGMGISLSAGQWAMRGNLVRLDGGGRLTEACPELSAEEGLAAGRRLMADAAFSALVRDAGWRFHPQPGFRQLITGDGTPPGGMTPPHNVQGGRMEEYRPGGTAGALMDRARDLFRDGGFGLWPWGAGAVPVYEPFEKKFGLRGAVISAVPVVKGMARLAGMDAPDIPGATGTLDTDWRAKADAVLREADTHDFVMLHIEAPDDCSHALDLEGKLRAIAMVDEAVARLRDGLAGRPYRLLLLPDHITSAETGRHDAGPVPWCVFDSRRPPGTPVPFAETDAGPVDGWDVPIRTLLAR